jgi:hypothetical protein
MSFNQAGIESQIISLLENNDRLILHEKQNMPVQIKYAHNIYRIELYITYFLESKTHFHPAVNVHVSYTAKV